MSKETNLKLTNLDKVFWPKEGYTKGDVIEYYRTISKYILPYLKDRPESLNRHPNGIEGESFYQKDVDHMPPDWVRTERIYSESGDKDINYLICDDQDTLLYMANLGCIEINPWNSRVGSLDNPDYIILDLDPEDLGFEYVIKTAQAIKPVLDELKLDGFPKTSGKTGIHVFIPVSGMNCEEGREIAHNIARVVHEKTKKFTSLERSPSKRQKKVYIDYLQNGRGQTLAAPYSLRPWPGATVSTPLEWKEVTLRLNPKKFTIKTIHQRLKKKGDLWQHVFLSK